MWVKIRLWWHRQICHELHTKKNEFHPSLNMDKSIMKHMCNCEKDRYLADLSIRRNQAHLQDMENFK